MGTHLSRAISIPEGSTLTEADYRKFLTEAYAALKRYPQFFAPDEDINDLELAHVLPAVAETVLAIYVGINDAVCNKGLVAPFLLRHAHNNVFVFDPAVFSGGRERSMPEKPLPDFSRPTIRGIPIGRMS
jgi:hypothetical protein